MNKIKSGDVIYTKNSWYNRDGILEHYPLIKKVTQWRFKKTEEFGLCIENTGTTKSNWFRFSLFYRDINCEIPLTIQDLCIEHKKRVTGDIHD